MDREYSVQSYHRGLAPQLTAFLEACLPESGRSLGDESRRSYYLGAAESSELFLCLFDGAEMIGTVAVKRLDGTDCELRSLYLYERFHGRGLGKMLLGRAIDFARESGFKRMLLDTISTSTRAAALYRRAGFAETARYKQTERSDVFMVLRLDTNNPTGGNTMNEIINAMKERRSCRAYKSELPPRELIEAVCEAGTFAATGMNRQSPIIVAVTNKELRDRLSVMNAKIMGKEGFDPFYGAPAVLIVLADKSIPTHVYDGSLVMGNLMLAAHTVGLASCWIHRAREEFESEEGKEILRSLGIEGEYEGIGHCVIGYAQNDPAPALPRKDNYVYFAE